MKSGGGKVKGNLMERKRSPHQKNREFLSTEKCEASNIKNGTVADERKKKKRERLGPLAGRSRVIRNETEGEPPKVAERPRELGTSRTRRKKRAPEPSKGGKDTLGRVE